MKSRIALYCVIVVIACCLVGCDSENPPSSTNKERRGFDLKKIFDFSFEKFKQTFNKHYGSLVEELVRQKIVLARAFRAFISRVSYKHFRTDYYLSVNENSDETLEERKRSRVSIEAMSEFNEGMTAESPEENAKTPVAEMKDIEEVLRELSDADSDSESAYKELSSELNDLQRSRKKRESLQMNHREEVSLLDLFSGVKDDEQANNKMMRQQLSYNLPDSNNPNYEQPELSSSAAAPGNNQQQQTNNLQEGLMNMFNNLPGAEFVRGVVDAAVNQMPKQAAPGEEIMKVDLRTTECFQEPRRQGPCGSCYAFAAIALYEFLYCSSANHSVAFSEQYMVDCGDLVGLMGCSGGRLVYAMTFVDKFGLELRAKYPYRFKNDTCPYEEDTNTQVMGYMRPVNPGFTLLAPSEFRRYLRRRRRPILIGIKVTPNFSDYGGGVDDGKDCGAEGAHAMLIVGYGQVDGQEFYLMRNSHSSSWGERGYYKFNLKAMEACNLSPHGFVTDATFTSPTENGEKKQNVVVSMKNPHYQGDKLISQRYHHYYYLENM